MKNVILSLFVLALSLALNIYNIDFPIGYHGDEVKKFHFVKTGKRDFKHPALMLELGQLATRFEQPDNKMGIAVRCRLISAVSGALIVFFLFWIVLKCMGPVPALIASAGLAVTPIMVIHAHYYKEDMVFTCASMLTLWALWGFCRRCTIFAALLLGLSLGLALSAQYKSVLLVALILIIPFFLGKIKKTPYYLKLPIVLSVAVFVFFAINFRIFQNTYKFEKGVTIEMQHVLAGHFVHVDRASYPFSFHLIESIGPGISWLFTALALAGLILMLIKWKSLAIPDRIFVVYAIIFYAAHEASPLKPFPDFSRYMIPVAPALFYFIAYLVKEASASGRKTVIRYAMAAVLAVSFVVTFRDAFLLDFYLKNDTRAAAQKLLRSSEKKTIVERYVLPSNKYDVKFLSDLDIPAEKKRGTQLLAASSLNYDRFYYGEEVNEQRKGPYNRREQYDRLFDYRYKEIRPAHRTYAFSNPVIRVIDISGD